MNSASLFLTAALLSVASIAPLCAQTATPSPAPQTLVPAASVPTPQATTPPAQPQQPATPAAQAPAPQAPAQQVQPAEDAPNPDAYKLVIRVNEVNLIFIVTDKKGRFI